MRGGGGGFGYGQNQTAHVQPQGAVRGRGRGGFQPGRPQPGKKETLKFDQEFDFEQANEQFKGIIDKLNKTKLDDNSGEMPMPGVPQEENGEDVDVEVVEGGEEGEIQDGEIKGNEIVLEGYVVVRSSKARQSLGRCAQL